MTRYELFEAWMTHDEWKTWKRLCISKFMRLRGITPSAARAARREYLHEPIPIDTTDSYAVACEWDNLVNMYLRWVDTPQGHFHWCNVNNRRQAIRTIN